MLEYLERLACDILYLMNRNPSCTRSIAYKKLLILSFNYINEKKNPNNVLDFIYEFWSLSNDIDFESYILTTKPKDEEILDILELLTTIDISYVVMLKKDIHSLSFPIVQKFFVQRNDLLNFINMINSREGLAEYQDYIDNLKIPSKYKKKRIEQMIYVLEEQFALDSNDIKVLYEMDEDIDYKKYIIETIYILENKVKNLID